MTTEISQKQLTVKALRDSLDNLPDDLPVYFRRVAPICGNIEEAGAVNLDAFSSFGIVSDCAIIEPLGSAMIPTFASVAARKLAELRTKGFALTGYSIEKTEDGGGLTRGFITHGGLVGWWAPESCRAPLTKHETPTAELSDEQIKVILLAHGYTIKTGLDDLKPYVYAGARAVVAAGHAAKDAPGGEVVSAPDLQPGSKSPNEQTLTELFTELRENAPKPTVEPNSQEWAGMGGATAFHLIERHADNWADVDLMMHEWLAANSAIRTAELETAAHNNIK